MAFHRWLAGQRGRLDLIGDLARLVSGYTRRPRQPNDLAAWQRYLRRKRAGSWAQRALEQAWDEYRFAP
jgi:hypothetical protein